MNRERTVIAIALASAAVCAVVIRKRQATRRRERKLWTKPWLLRRHEQQHDASNNILDSELHQDPVSFQNYLRMPDAQFLKLLAMVSPFISRQDTVMRQAISPRNRLAITLRFLATGETFRSLMYATRIHESTISNIVTEVCAALYAVLKKDYLKIPSTEQEWLEIANDFYVKWNFPNCLGALDGKHIVFRAKKCDGSYYLNHKGQHSIVLMALVDANYKILYLDVGANGHNSYDMVYCQCSLNRAIINGALNIPHDRCLPGIEYPAPYVIVADDAFSQYSKIMKPYDQRGLTPEKRIFNYRLSRARRVVENAFDIFANRFRILLAPISLSVDKVEAITLTVCALHNFLIQEKVAEYVEIDEAKASNIGSIVERQAGNRPPVSALQIRDLFRDFFMSDAGAIPRQYDIV